jgi:hypothetical protein
MHEKHVLMVPTDKLPCGALGNHRRWPETLAMQRIVGVAVVIIVTQTRAHLKSEVFGHRHVPLIQQPMQIGTEQKAILHIVRPALREGHDVGGLQRREGVLARDRTGSLVSLRDGDPERALSQARHHESWVAIPGKRSSADGRLLPRNGWCHPGHAQEAGVPHALPFTPCEVVAFGRLRSNGPISGLWHPRIQWEEERLHDQNAANLVQCHRFLVADPLTDARDPLPHLSKVVTPIAALEGFPCQPIWEDGVSGEVSKPTNGVVRGAELEQKGRVWLCVKRAPGRGGPKVHLV